MPEENIFILSSDADIAHLLETGILRPAGYRVTLIGDRKQATDLIKVSPPDLVVLGDRLNGSDYREVASSLLASQPNLPIILMPNKHVEGQEVEALRLGFSDYLTPPVRTNEVLEAVKRGLERRQRLDKWMRVESRRNTKSLQNRLNGLEALQRVGRSVTALLDLDNVLKAVVDAAVDLSGAEKGSLLLLDEATGELYMRAARNFHEDFVRTFRLPIRDSVPGQVLRTGKPLFLNEKEPQKIKTSYLVYTLIYVPLQIHGRVIGVLGVDNQQGGKAFSEEDISMLATLGDYAAIAIENARLFSRSESERQKLETILTNIEDGVIVVDHEGRVAMINEMAKQALKVNTDQTVKRPLQEVLQNNDLLDLIGDDNDTKFKRTEITLDDGRVFNAQLTPIPEVGVVVTMQDITHLKELDRIKSDFVSTVSHDLRSPLTAILGYVELIERAGTVNAQQRDFIRRVQFSVNNITSLINDLLDLGRIEAGFDALKELIHLNAIIRYAIEGLRTRIEEKEQNLQLELDENLPPLLGNPARLRQMVGNLLGNAVKYTQNKGVITIRLTCEEDQIIFQMTDNGPGIPPSDQPYIFDKFYRASNIPGDIPGTGLGLAIVKSIIENHQGRIWVNSALNQGTTFTVVLPVAKQGL